ncbi:hypothetical protein [Ruegeria atlantica]|nr:hypothetical protein [Ruegeria atlantica]
MTQSADIQLSKAVVGTFGLTGCFEPKAVKGKRPFLVDAIDEIVLSAKF